MIVVPVYEKTLAPDSTLFLLTEQLKRYSGNKGVAFNERIVFLVAKENTNLSDLRGDSFYPIGISGVVKDIQRGYLTIRTQYRVNIENVTVNPDYTIHLTMSRRPDTEDLDKAIEAGKLRALKEELKKFSSGASWGGNESYFRGLNFLVFR